MVCLPVTRNFDSSFKTGALILFNKTIHMTLKEARKGRGYTQKELAEIIGVSYVAVSLIERGRLFPKPKTRHRIEAVLNMDIQWPEPDGSVFRMMSQYIGQDPAKAKTLQRHINNHVDVISLNIKNYTRLIKSKK